MENSLNFDNVPSDASRQARAARSGRSGARAAGSAHARVERPELQAGEPIDIYHWAAVALVTALMCAVLSYAAGTPALSRAANLTSIAFGVLGGALVAAGLIRAMRRRLLAARGDSALPSASNGVLAASQAQ